ncbi:putative repeat protein (TIGR02543 family) [Leifsonia psychrotolerans]|uniref:Putative repeat protein (TIGR02543 family) n=2 Tax=Glaciibacter psychrotolerans TaxID=670054 RepID=A0A7Z0EG64_9MICO|nr:putative repeat protein (TIGR02543 family) [Leifsonia psychrotolerans]
MNAQGTGPDQSVIVGAKASVPTPPTATGLEFTTWYADAALTTPFTFNNAITADVTVYAGWESTVSFNLGGHGTIATQSVVVSKKAQAPASPITPPYTPAGASTVNRRRFGRKMPLQWGNWYARLA